MTDRPLGFGPDPAGGTLFRASKLLDELPVLHGLPAKGGLAHAMGDAESLDVGKQMLCHSGNNKRVVTRTSSDYAGICPILRVRTRFSHNGVVSEGVKIDLARLRALVIENAGPGKKFSRRSLSLAATDGRNPDLIRDLMRVDKRHPTIEAAAGICRALNVDLSSVVNGVPPASEGAEWLTVCAEVRAGVWHERVDWQPEDCFQVRVGPTLDGRERFGVRVDGRSMDRVILPGMILECVRLIGSDLEPVSGDYVIVDRTKDGLHEFTCKRLHRRPDGDYELVAESTLPEFAEPIHIGQPDEFLASDNEIRVVAIVIRAHANLFRSEDRRQAPPEAIRRISG